MDQEWIPVHEGDYGHQFDHRFGTFDGQNVRIVTVTEHQDPNLQPDYELLAKRDAYEDYCRRWELRTGQSALLAFRRNARSTDDALP